MAEDKNKQALDLGSLATGGTQEPEQLQEKQLDEVNGGVNKELKNPNFIRS